VTRAPKRVASLVDLAAERSVRETGTLDADPAGHSGSGEDALHRGTHPEGGAMNGRSISPHRLAVALAGVMTCWHIAWSLLVLAGWAQPFVDFVFWLHFITPPYQVGEFAPWRALGLIIVTAVLGYAFGGLIGVIWNRVHASQRSG
jgi:hypothetical protein